MRRGSNTDAEWTETYETGDSGMVVSGHGLVGG